MKKAIALKLLKSKKARQLSLKALKHKKVQKLVVDQVGRRLTGR